MLVKFMGLAVMAAAVLGQSPAVQVSAAKAPATTTSDEEIEKEVRALTDVLVTAFNEGKSDAIAGLFLPAGELIDDAGTVHQGPAEVKTLLDQFFQTFSGAKVQIEIESIRSVGPVVIQEGVRSTTRGEVTSRIQFTCVLAKTNQGWRIASLRDFPEATLPTPGEQLQSLEWLVGEWVNEGADARVRISYQWSEDKNFLLGEFQIFDEGKVVGKSSQRIGWDPVLGKPRSWLFDSDGGFSEAVWTMLEDGRWILRSSAVLPDGMTASATLTITPSDTGRLFMQAAAG